MELRLSVQLLEPCISLAVSSSPRRPTCPGSVHYADVAVLLWVPAVKIGRPGYRVTKQYDADSFQRSLLFQVSKELRDRDGSGARCRKVHSNIQHVCVCVLVWTSEPMVIASIVSLQSLNVLLVNVCVSICCPWLAQITVLSGSS